LSFVKVSGSSSTSISSGNGKSLLT
jgi:hypothetical protein